MDIPRKEKRCVRGGSWGHIGGSVSSTTWQPGAGQASSFASTDHQALSFRAHSLWTGAFLILFPERGERKNAILLFLFLLLADDTLIDFTFSFSFFPSSFRGHEEGETTKEGSKGMRIGVYEFASFPRFGE